MVRQGRLQEAESQARRALSDPDTRAVAYAILGGIRLEQKKYDESIRFLKQAIHLEPRLQGARLNLALATANTEASKGNYKRSLDAAQPVLENLKQSPDGLVLLATDFLKTGDRDSAAALVGDWKKLPDPPVAWTTSFATVLASGGLAAEAADILDLALARDASSLPALQLAAGIAEQRGELERALSYWLRAKKLQPDKPEILFGFGKVCLKMDLLDDAEPALARAVELRPEQAGYQYALASVRVGKRRFADAMALLNALLAKQPRDPQLNYAAGAVLYLEAKLDEAARKLRESIRLQADQVASYYYLGLIARDEGKADQAIHTFEELLRRHPAHAPSHEALGTLLMSAGRYAEARRSLERALDLNPRSVKANYQLGLLLGRVGNKEDAAKRLEIARSLRQQDAENSRLQLRLLEPEQ